MLSSRVDLFKDFLSQTFDYLSIVLSPTAYATSFTGKDKAE